MREVITNNGYFQRPEISNSDLRKFYEITRFSKDELPDPQIHFDFGNLFDALVTEPNKVNYFEKSIVTNENQILKFTKEDFSKAEKMKYNLLQNEVYKKICNFGQPQLAMINTLNLEYLGIKFKVQSRCKYDFYIDKINFGWDLKSTTAKSQKEFESACEFFDYDAQSQWYMDTSESNKHVLIGVSKKNFKVFIKQVLRDDDFYMSGLKKNSYRAFYFRAFYNKY